MKFAVLAALAAPVIVSAQYGPPAGDSSSSSAASSSAAPTPSAAPGEHIVMVAPNLGFTFAPNTVDAAENETVRFIFPTSGGFMHSVTQAAFAKPCELLSGGFDSGLQANGMEFSIKITNASAPIWFYCKQTDPLKHCGMGMVGGINIKNGTANTIDAFTAAAKALGNNEGAQTASGGLTGVGAIATAPASSASAASPSSSSGAERTTVGAGSLLAALFGLFALA